MYWVDSLLEKKEMKKSSIALICGIILFVVGFTLPIFSQIKIDITIGNDMIFDFPIGLWLQTILIGSGLGLSGIAIIYEFMARKYL